VQPTKSLSDFGTQLHDPSGHAAIDATFFDREKYEQALLPSDELPRSDA
jgi:hypothetical protein